MIIRLLFSLLFSFTLFFSQAQNFSFSENQNKEGLEITSSKENTIRLSYHIHQFNLSPINIQGQQMAKLSHGMNIINGKAGTPDLPFIGANILIPDGAEIEIVILSADKETYQNIEISPSAEIPFDTQDDIPAKVGKEYAVNAFFPTKQIDLKTTEIRGMNIASIGISPFQYNPITKELIVFKNLDFELKITQSKGTYGEDRFRSPFWDQILSDLVINTDDIPVIDYQKRPANSKEDGCEYLIIVPNDPDFRMWADTIKQFRNEQGIHTKVVTIDDIGGNDVGIIDNYIKEVYNNWDPVPSAVLLMADYGDDDKTIISKRYDHPYQGTYISDNHYADVTNNNLPDFVFARMTGRDSDELKNMVYKFINYERNPPVLESFYNEPITALGWQTERWFQLCSETIGGYMQNTLGKNPTRINAVYDGNPNTDPWSTASGTSSIVNYFGPNGLNYIPTSPSELGNWSGGNANDVVNALNKGAFILQHRDHGSYGGWGEPGFHSSHINQLNNESLLSHIFSINCLTGQFDAGTNSFAEKFHRKENSGALSLTAASQVSYSFVNDAFVWGMYDNMWPDFMPAYGGNLVPERDFRPAFGSASGKYFLSTSNWANAGTKTITYRLFHHHGDAFNIVYTEMPQENNITYEAAINANITTIAFKAEPFSLVGLSINGELLASGICATNGQINIDIPQQVPQTEIKVVITKQNYFRHEGNILIIPAAGPYVIPVSYSIDDENANNNGIIEYGEEISLDFIIKNVGVDLAENIVISLSNTDDYIQITDGEKAIGDMNSDEEISLDKAFTFTVSNDIPDQHQITLIFTATDGGDNAWEKVINYTVNAPHLEFTVLNFEEIEGNGNGYFDPGETVSASFEMTNTGHCNFPQGNSSLIANSNEISINAETIEFTEISINESLITTFEMSSLETTPYSTMASIIQNINASPFEISRELFFNIGIIVEDWETEDFTSFDWQMLGDKEWEIAEDYVFEGDYSVKLAELGDNQSAAIELPYEVFGESEISFHTQVSSQVNHDIFSFYIDDILQESWSGLLIFEQVTYPVSGG
ncbi:MAG: hypothetical protein KAH25_07090, partial [Bacteroidales bacterium]|nr:hypothetical protein [Bacteroidales bacterium]